jgi:NADH dehydrogenase
VFSPLLYELLTNELQPWEVTPAYADLFQNTPIRQLLTLAESIDLKTKQVRLAPAAGMPDSLSYDYLVVATGSRDRMLPIPGWQEHTYRFRTLADVQRLDTHLADLERRSSTSSIRIVLVGAGPSGVELACKLADRLGARGEIHLVDRGTAILSALPERVRRVAMRALTRRRVCLHLQAAVTAVEATHVHLQTQTSPATLYSDITINTAGTQPRSWLGDPTSLAMSADGFALTRPTLQLLALPEVFVVGDQTMMPWQEERSAPPTAQAAYQGAAVVAKNLLRLMEGQVPLPFRYTHLGNMMTLGDRDALVASAGILLQGRFASLIRQIAYTYRLPPGGRHRWQVARHRLHCCWCYLWQRTNV